MSVPRPLPFARPEEVGLSADRLERLSGALADEVERGRLPGAVALVARRGRIAWLDCVGVRAPDASQAMTDDSVFRIYSMTKPIVSVAAMMLVEAGRLMITDPVSRYLPAFANQRVLRAGPGDDTAPTSRESTIQDLLRHTSGLTYEFLGEGPVHRMYVKANFADRGKTSAQLCEKLATIPLLHQPGSAFAYGRSTDVLGHILELVTGKRLGAVLDEMVLGPLGMTDTGFHVPARAHARIAEPFAHDPETGAAVQLFDPRKKVALEMGGGGLMSTATDYARFLQMLLDGGSFDGERLLSRKTIEFMTSDHLGAIPVDGDLLSPGYGFGLGFAVRIAAGIAPTAGTVGQYHWGGLAGTTFWVDPREQLFAILLIQAPNQREYYRLLFRNLVYAAFAD